MALMHLLHREPPPATLLERMLERIPLEQIRERVPFQMKPEPPSRLRRAAPLLGAGVTGAVLAYAFDPASGRERRAKAREKVSARLGRGSRAGMAGEWHGNGRATGAESIASDR